MQAAQLSAHRDAQLGVEVAQRLVHQERLRLAHDRAAHRDPLPLAAGQLAGLAVEHLLQAQDARDLVDPRGDVALGRLAQLQAEAEVPAHRQMRVERVVLEDHRDVALARVEPGDVPAADVDRAGRRLLDPGDQLEQRRLAAARRADEHHELALVDIERHVVDGARPVPVRLGHAGDANSVVHVVSVTFCSPWGRRRRGRGAARRRSRAAGPESRRPAGPATPGRAPARSCGTGDRRP